MDTGEKPFPCKIDGCKLSFTTEDHLNVHRKKHDKLLNLELPNKSNLFADQTPTPTRLIGKCEEVGLFEDLQKVNPFEETFRRAVEEKSSSSSELAIEKEIPTLGVAGTGDETLHTPHVFPLLERRDSNKLSKLIISRSISKKDDVPTDATSQSGTLTEIKPPAKRKQQQFINSRSKKPAVNILPKCAPPSQPVIIISCERDDALSVINTTTPLHPVKAKLKKYLTRNGSSATDKATPSQSIAKTLNNQSSIKTSISEDKPAQPREESTDQKHERWKAAARRYRTRVKQNQDSLHRKNIDLEEENLRLRTELAQLRSALSLHKNCSVTRALAAGSTANGTVVPTTPKVLLVPVIGQPSVQQSHVNPINTVPVQPVQPAIVNSDNPVYIILGGIDTASKTKQI